MKDWTANGVEGKARGGGGRRKSDAGGVLLSLLDLSALFRCSLPKRGDG